MKNERVEQIKMNLSGFGTNADEVYTNQEIVDILKEFQSALARGVFEKTHAENLQDRDILIHFEALAKEYGLDQTEEFIRLKSNMTKLGFTIGTFIKGMNGERITRRALKLLSFDKGVNILYNIQLKDEDAEAEYDAIVLSPHGMFVIEVKNWASSVVITPEGLITRNDNSGIVYDLAGRMSIKQALLREYIGENFPDSYHSILVFANERAKVEDQYTKIPVVCGGGLSYKIRDMSANATCLTDEQISSITNIILAHHEIQTAASPVNCEEIIEDYAVLMARIEGASSGVSEDVRDSESCIEAIETSTDPTVTINKRPLEYINRKRFGKYIACAASVAIPVIACGFLQFRRNSLV